nr:hypothetical protein [Tanacetum cinerariifolium]
MAFISLAKNNSGKGEVNTASIPTASTYVSPASADVAAAIISLDTVCAYIASQSNGSQIKYEDINQIDEDDIEEMDIKGLEFDLKNKNIKIENLLNELEQIKKEKEDTVLFPPPAHVYSPLKKDMSWTGLPEFADDTITDYSRPSLSIKSNPSDLQNIDSFVFENEESLESIMSKPMIKFAKAADSPTVIKTNKVETVRKLSVKYAEMYRNTTKSPKVRGNQRNWNNLKTQQLGKDF